MDQNNYCYTDYTVIDIETTGFSTRFDDIIEISAIRVRDNLIVDEYTELIATEKKVPDFIYQLTGISNEMLKGKDNVIQVIDRFFCFIGMDLLIGHNIKFDLNFIESKSGKKPLNNYIDTLHISRRVIKDINNHKLTTLAQHFNIRRDTHRGLEDCNVTYGVYLKLIEQINLYNIDLNVKHSQSSIDYHRNLDSITPTIDIDTISSQNFYFDKYVVVTGKMERYTKFEFGQKIVNSGGHFCDSINRNTNVLILGNQDYQESLYGAKSSKHLRAIEMINNGSDIIVIDESTALELISD